MSLAKDSNNNLQLLYLEAQAELEISEQINNVLKNKNDLSSEQIEFWTSKSLHHLEMAQSGIRILEAFRDSYQETDTTTLVIPLKQDTLH